MSIQTLNRLTIDGSLMADDATDKAFLGIIAKFEGLPPVQSIVDAVANVPREAVRCNFVTYAGGKRGVIVTVCQQPAKTDRTLRYWMAGTNDLKLADVSSIKVDLELGVPNWYPKTGDASGKSGGSLALDM